MGRIQCVKMIEALLVLTIPIVHRARYRWGFDDEVVSTVFFALSPSYADGVYPAHDDLVSLGFPLAVVEIWLQVTEANLTRWWRELAPRSSASGETACPLRRTGAWL